MQQLESNYYALTTNLSGWMLMATSNVSFSSNGKEGWSLSSSPQSPPDMVLRIQQFSFSRGLKWSAMSLSSLSPHRRLIAKLKEKQAVFVKHRCPQTWCNGYSSFCSVAGYSETKKLYVSYQVHVKRDFNLSYFLFDVYSFSSWTKFASRLTCMMGFEITSQKLYIYCMLSVMRRSMLNR